jgi:fibronectin-binding autotransporter adhesin
MTVFYGANITKFLRFALTLGCTLMAGYAIANPQGGTVSNGNATISASGSTTTINQTSQQAIINWNSFNIAAGETTHFQQPTQGVALNRINATQGASQIYGTLSATGRVILINAAGIHFGPGSMVNVGSIIASTSDISDKNFLNGVYSFDRPSRRAGSIINEGTIKTAKYGLAALLGTGVVNSGMIQANLGSIVLGSGSKFTLNFSGDDLVNFTVDEATTKAGRGLNGTKLKNGVENSGELLANGGKILVSAEAAAGVLDNAIDMSGVAIAHSTYMHNGEIILSGGNGNDLISGLLSVTGRHSGLKGGLIQILGQNIHLVSSAVIDASGDAGGGVINIGGSAHGAGPLPDATNTTVDQGAVINASAITSGNGGDVVVWANGVTNFDGSVVAVGGTQGGNGGDAELSGHDLLDFEGSVNLTAVNGSLGTLLLDPEDITIQTTGPDTVSNSSNTYTPTANESVLTVATLIAALGSANVTVSTSGSSGSGTGGGSITVANALTWSSANTLTLNAASNIYINAPISAVNGGLTLTAGSSSAVITSTSSTTGVNYAVNVAKFSLTQGNWTQVNTTLLPSFTATNNFSLTTGSVTFIRAVGGTGGTGSNAYQIADIYGLQGINSNSTTLGYTYQLANNIDASVTQNWSNGFTSISSYTKAFEGNFYTINNLKGSGLFSSVSGGSINDVGLTNVNIASGGTYIGALADSASSESFNYDYVTGNVLGSSYGYTGGLIGQGNAITVNYSYNTANVTSQVVGGLVGVISGNSQVNNSYSSGGTLSGPGGGAYGYIGGIVGTLGNGTNSGPISINETYNASPIPGTDNVTGIYGNIVGYYAGNGSGNPSVSITNSYWDSSISGQGSAYPPEDGRYGNTAPSTSSVGGVSLSSTLSNYSGFSSSNWVVNSGSYATLLTERQIGGIVPGVGSGDTVDIYQNGTLLSAASTNAAGGFTDTVAKGSTALTAGADLLFVSAISGLYSNVVTLVPNTGDVNVSLANNTVQIGDTNTNSFSNTALSNALLGISASSNILFSATTTTLTLGDGGTDTTINLVESPTSTYSLGNITYSSGTSGTLTFNGTVNLASNSTLSANGITLAGTVNGNGYSLGLSGSANVITGSVNNVTTFSLAGGGTDTLSGSISSASTQTYSDALNLSGTETLNSGGAITFSGAVNGAGALTLASGSSIDTFSSTVGATTALTSLSSTGSGQVVLSHGVGTSILGIGSINISGASSLGASVYSSGAQTFSGTTTLTSAVTLDSLSGGSISLANITGGANALTVNTSGSASITGAFSGTGANLIQAGSGTLNISGSNTYTGGTTVSSGTLQLGANNASSTTGTLTISSGATFDLNGHNDAIGLISGTGSLANSGSASALTVEMGSSASAGFAGTLANTVNLTVGNSSADTGTFTLSGSNSSYTGTLTANFGILQVVSTTAIGSAAISVNSTGELALDPAGSTTFSNTITLNGGTLADTNTGLTNVVSSLSMPTSSIISVASGEILKISNSVTGSATASAGTAGLTKTGTGTLEFTAANIYTGTTQVSAGTLELGIANGVAAGSALNLSASGAIFNMNSFSDTIGALSGSGQITNLNSGKTLTVDMGTTSTTYSGTIAGNGGGLTIGSTIADTGNLTLTGTNTSYAIPTTITDGALTISNSAALDSGSIGVSFGGSLNLITTANTSFGNAITLNGGSVVDVSTSSNTNTLSNLALGTASSTIGVINTGETLNVISMLSGASIGITKSGGGTLELSAANTYTGATQISTGTLELGVTNAISSASAVSDASTFNMNGFSDTIGALTGVGTVSTATGKILTIEQGAGPDTFAGTFTGSGGVTIGSVTADTGTFQLTATSSSFTGPIVIAKGTLQLGVANAIGDSALTVNSGATFDMNGASDAIGPLAGAGSIINLSSGKTLTIEQAATNNTFSGTITGAGNVTLGNSGSDTGTLTISGTNSSYTGTTTVADGILQIANAAALGTNVTVNSGAELALNNSAATTFSNAITANGSVVDLSTTAHTNTLSDLILGTNTVLGTTLAAEILNVSDALTGTSVGLTITSTGTVELSGANTYSGATKISTGTLELGAANAVGSGSTLNILAGATFNMNSFSELSGVLMGAGSITNLATGKVLTVQQGSGTNTFSGVISGAGNLTVGNSASDSGILQLSGANTYSGGTTVAFGKLQLGASNSVASALTINTGATFDMNSFSDLIGALSGGGSIANLTTGQTLTSAQGSTATTFSGTIAGAGTFQSGKTSADTGTLTLGGNNSSLTNLTVAFGIVQVSASNNLAATLNTVNTGAQLALSTTTATSFSVPITINGSGISNTGAIDDIGTSGVTNTLSNVSLGTSAGFGVASANETLNISDVLSGASAGLIKFGAGTLELSNANTYAGTTLVEGTGSLELGIANAIGNSSSVSIITSTLNMNGFSDAIALLSGNGSVQTGGATLTISQGAATDTYSGIISGTGGVIVGAKAGDTGTLKLSGVNTYSGATYITSGTLAVGVANAIASNSSVSVSSGATLNMNSLSDAIGPLSGTGSITSLISGQTLTIEQAATTNTFSGTISGAGNLTIGNSAADTGTLILSGANSSTYTGTTTVSHGVLQIPNSGALGTNVTVNTSGELALNTSGNTTFTNTITDNGSVLDTSTGHTNSLSGLTLGTGAELGAASGETLNVTNALTGSVGVSINSTGLTTGTVELSSASNIYNGGTQISSGTLELGAANALPGAVSISSGATLNMNSLSDSIGQLTGTGNVTNLTTSQTLTVEQGSGTDVYSGIISGTGGSLTVGNSSADNGVFEISGANTYSGATTINFGTLELGATNSVPASTNGLSIASNGIFNMNGFSDQIGALSGAGAITNATTAKTLTVDVGSYSNTFSGTISALVNLTIGNSSADNTGTLILTGNSSSYSGATSITDGILQISSSGILNNGAIAVATNGKLDLVTTTGTTFTNAIALNGGSLVDAGTAGVTNIINSVSLSGSSTISVSSSNETLNVTSGLSGAGLALSKTGSGTLELSGANTYTGATNVTAGTLELGQTNAISGSSVSVTGGATFNENGFSDVIGQLSGAGSVTTSTGTNLTIAQGAGSAVFSGTFSGAGSLTVGNTSGDTGTFELSGANSNYSGAITVGHGTLELGVTNAISGNAVTLNSGTTLNMNSVSDTIGSLSGAGNISNLTTGKMLTVEEGGNNTSYSGSISGAGGLTVGASSSDTGTLSLTGANAYTGSTSVNDGILQLNASNNLSSSSAVQIAANAELSLSNLTGTLANAISGSGNLQVSGSSNVTLSGGNSFSGTTSIGGGELILSSTLGSGLINVAANTTLEYSSVAAANAVNLNGGTLTGVGTSSDTGAVTVGTTGTSTISTASSSDKFTLSGAIDGDGALALSGAGNVVISSAVGSTTPVASLASNAGKTTINNNVTSVGNQAYNGAVVLTSNATLKTTANTSSVAVNDGISGAFNLTVNGSDAITLAGSLAVKNINVTGVSGSPYNLLTVQSPDAETWNITGTNAGTITGISEETGNFTFTNVQGVGGSLHGNTFQLMGGSINTINGSSSGNNTIIAGSGADTFNLTGMNSGSLTGVTTYTGIQNLTGGSSTNDFVFSNNGGVTGMIAGTGSSGNTIDYSAYTAPVTLTVSADGAGSTTNSSSSTISNFTNIQNAYGNGSSTLDITANKANNITFSSSTQAAVDDPINTNGFTTFDNSGNGSALVTFGAGTNAVFTAPTVASINGGPAITFINMSFAGNFVPFGYVPPSPIPVTAASVSIPQINPLDPQFSDVVNANSPLVTSVLPGTVDQTIDGSIVITVNTPPQDATKENYCIEVGGSSVCSQPDYSEISISVSNEKPFYR